MTSVNHAFYSAMVTTSSCLFSLKAGEFGSMVILCTLIVRGLWHFLLLVLGYDEGGSGTY